MRNLWGFSARDQRQPEARAVASAESLVGRHNQRSSETQGCRDSPIDWADGRATRYLVRRHRPSGAAEPVRVDRHQSRPGIGYSARKTAATGICGVFRIRTARRGLTFPAPDGTADLVPLPSRPTLKWGGVMSDGREEREEREVRIEQEKQENREDRIDRDDEDESEPERVDS